MKATKFKLNLAFNICPPGGTLIYNLWPGMCRYEGYGFKAVWSGIGCRNQGALV